LRDFATFEQPGDAVVEPRGFAPPSPALPISRGEPLAGVDPSPIAGAS